MCHVVSSRIEAKYVEKRQRLHFEANSIEQKKRQNYNYFKACSTYYSMTYIVYLSITKPNHGRTQANLRKSAYVHKIF
jgi:hypothetical protein